MYFSYFEIISPLEMGGALHFPLTQGCFVPSLIEIGPMVLEKKMKMCKVYDNNNDNDYGLRTNFDRKSSLEPSAQVSVKGHFYIYITVNCYNSFYLHYYKIYYLCENMTCHFENYKKCVNI